MGTTTSFNNTPHAGDDFFTAQTTGLTEDSLFVTYLAVMANDLGGAAKTLYSLDDGTNSIGVLSPTDLLAQRYGQDRSVERRSQRKRGEDMDYHGRKGGLR